MIKKTKLKKPLVKTFRIKRLILSYIVVFSLIEFMIVYLSWCNSGLFLILAVLVVMLSSFVIIVCNILVFPLEKLICLGFIVKAKKKLKLYSNLIVIGVTGSYGKTSVKNYLNEMLSAKYSVLATPNSFNTPMGITKTILNYLKPHHQVLILEMGADHVNDIKKLCKIVSPDICVVTAVAEQHLKTFKTINNIIKTKYQIVEYSKPNAVFVTNLTNNVCLNYFNKTSLEKYGVGFNCSNAFCNVLSVNTAESGSEFEGTIDNVNFLFKTKLLGSFNVINIMLAMAVAYKLGVGISELNSIVYNLKPVSHRLELKHVNANVLVLDDSFNSNPVGAKCAIETLKSFTCKKFVITCGMVELGDVQYSENFKFGKRLSFADCVLVVNSVNYDAISNGVISAGGKKPIFFNSFIDAYNYALNNIKEKTVILIENDLTDSYIVWGKMKENLIVLFGGVSSEHDISIISAMQAIKNIDANFYNVIPVYLAKNYKWYVGKNLTDLQFFVNPDLNKLTEVCLISGSNYLYYKKINKFKPKIKIDFALPVLHGVNGEDGKVVALLSMCKIPYSSADYIESGLGVDKCLFKKYVNGLGVNTIRAETIIDYVYRLNPQKVINSITKQFDFPLIVKPATLGSSIGITVCKTNAELENAVQLAFSLSNKILVEEYLEHITELNIALVLDGGNIIVSDVEQPIKNSNILSFENKYINKTGTMEGVKRLIPAPISDEVKLQVEKFAKLVYCDMGLKGVVRFDFILHEDNVYLNEVNTIPGSLAFYLFKSANISYKQLINILIKNGYINSENLFNKTYSFSSSVLNGAGEGIKK